MLLLRPKERYPVDASGAARLLQRGRVGARDALPVAASCGCTAARTRGRAGVLVAAVRLAPRDGRRPVVTGAAAAVGAHAGEHASPRCRCAPRRASAPRTSGWSRSRGAAGRSTSPRATAIGGVFAAAGGAAAGRSACAASAATGGRRARPRSSGFARRLHLPRPGRARPDLQQVHAAAGGRDARRRARPRAQRAGVEVGEVYEVDASRRTTAANAYVTGLGHTKRVVLYDTLLKDFTPAETRLVVAHELGHVAPPRRPARAAVARAGRAVRDARRRPRRASGSTRAGRDAGARRSSLALALHRARR